MYRVSLSTQSMNINSLQRNREMHSLVLSHLTDAYAEYEGGNDYRPNTAKFMRKSIANMAGMQLCIYLTMKDEKTYKKETQKMLGEIRQKSEKLYQEINQAPAFRLLTMTRFLVF